jgi:hypothetical protein
MKTTSIRAFMHGMGSVLCLMPFKHVQAEPQTTPLSTQVSDAVAIGGDFRVVGETLSTAMNSETKANGCG